MTRIVAGSLKSRQLLVPQTNTRPTSERVRESLFAILEHQDALDQARVLDVFAGSGALGFEALSRGAAWLTLVESNQNACKILEKNAANLGVSTATSVQALNAERFLNNWLPSGRTPNFHLIFLDPPYALPSSELDSWLELAAAKGLLAPAGVLVLERPRRAEAPNWPSAWREISQRVWGDTAVYLAENPYVDADAAEQETVNS